MIKGHIAILILLCFCCTSDIKNEYKFESSETILHFDKGNTKIQMIISSYSANEPELNDTSLIVQRYQDSLKIEEINYSLKNGDSVEWSHNERTYNDQGLLLTEIVTNAGQQMLQLCNIYENGRLIISETNSFMPLKSKEMESTEYDTIKSRDMRVYDEQNRCVKVYSIKKNDLLTALADHTNYDTIVTNNVFDEKSNLVKSVSKVKGDTTEIYYAGFDEKNRMTFCGTTSSDFGVTAFKYLYDENNNSTTEIFIDNDITTRTEIIYDSLKRPIRRQTFKIELPIVH